MGSSDTWSPIAWTVLVSLVVTGLVSSYVLVVTDDAVPATRERLESNYYLLLGRRWARQEMYPEAIDAFTRAIDIWPNSAESHHRLGSVYLASGAPEKALVPFHKASELSPFDSIPVSSIGYSYFAMGEYIEAVGQFERAMEMDPTNWAAKRGYARSKLQLGLPQEAEP